MTADPANRVSERKRHGRHIEDRKSQCAAPLGPDHHEERAADHAAVPDQPRARKDAPKYVAADTTEVLKDPDEPGADKPSGQRRKDRLVGPISWQTPFQQSAMEHRAGCEEGQREHQTEGLERKPKEIDLRLHAERLEVTERVGHLTIDAHLKVEVITEAKTGTTDVADYLTLADVLPNRGGKPGLVGVAGGKR